MLSRLLAGSGGGARPLWIVVQSGTVSSSDNFWLYKWNPGQGFIGVDSSYIGNIGAYGYAKVIPDGSALFHSKNISDYFGAVPFSTSSGLTGGAYSFSATAPTDVGNFQRIAIHPDGDVVAVSQNSFPWINVYQFSQALGIHTRYANAATNPGRAPYSLDWSPDGTVLLVNSYGYSYEKNLFAWEFDKTTGFGSEYINQPPTLTYSTYSARWSPEGTRIAYGRSGGDHVAVATWPSGGWRYGTQFEPTSTGVSHPDEAVRAIAWSPNGRYIACGLDAVSSGRSIEVYEIHPNGYFVQRFTSSAAGLPTSRVYDIAFSPDGRAIFWAGDYVGVNRHIGAIEWLDDDGFGDVYLPSPALSTPTQDARSVSIAPRTP